MPQTSFTIRAHSRFWDDAARVLLQRHRADGRVDLSGLRVVVSAFSHARLLKDALSRQLGGSFIPPRIVTLAGWSAQLPPGEDVPAAGSARLMDLYAELRRHGWLKKIFSARRNTDLLPLAQVLLTLSDELTLALLPDVQRSGDQGYQLWQKALEQLSPSARRVVTDEAQLVWSIWQAQLDGSDPQALRFRRMMQLAAMADLPLVWIAADAPDAFEAAFLQAYAERRDVLRILPDWSTDTVPALLYQAWPELLDASAEAEGEAESSARLEQIRLSPAAGMEQEAQRGAQTVLDWLAAGKTSVAVIAQDRVVARRLRALLERAQVYVADETGWKLSTTRAASAVAAWFDVVTARAETLALLDLLKSPFTFADLEDKQWRVMRIEVGLRNANVQGGWDAVNHALAGEPGACQLTRTLAQQASQFAGRKSLRQWSVTTEACLQTLGIWPALQQDAAGVQVLDLLRAIGAECAQQEQDFSFAEWRAFVGVQLESTSFIAPELDRRVVMLTLHGAQLRSFDAVLMLGCDAEHLPSQSGESLFFANTVRRELGLATRETVHLQQMRDFAMLLTCNEEVVLSWQQQRNGEPNPASTWIARLELAMERAALGHLAQHAARIAVRNMTMTSSVMPRPAAAALLPKKLSAGGYGSLVACPYQFFATRMLGLSGLEELSDMPEKRDYGDWLHQILFSYHESLREQALPPEQREALLRAISAQLFEREAADNAAALGYYVRWKKVMPDYVAWANQREAEGWRFAYGERKFEKILRWQASGETDRGEIVLHGRLDRVDVNADERLSLLDYKTRSASQLRDKLKQGEDRQLAFYGILSEGQFSEAQYVSLDAQSSKFDVEAPDFAAAQHSLEQQLTHNLQALARGAALPATGIEDVCGYCAVRGLCRKGAW